MIKNIYSIQQVFLKRFRDPIRVPRIREIGSLQIHIGYLTYSLKKTDAVKMQGKLFQGKRKLLKNPQ